MQWQHVRQQRQEWELPWLWKWWEKTGNTVHKDIELSFDAFTGILELLQRQYWYRM
jgi:hypothetical protein